MYAIRSRWRNKAIDYKKFRVEGQVLWSCSIKQDMKVQNFPSVCALSEDIFITLGKADQIIFLAKKFKFLFYFQLKRLVQGLVKRILKY